MTPPLEKPADKTETEVNNIPVHAPLYDPSLTYGSNQCEALTVLVESDAATLQELLEPTPFEFIVPYAWIEIVVLREAFGVRPFASGGVIIPAHHPPSGLDGGYYAFCYIDTDEGLALGREPFGYPKKYADVTLTKTGTMAHGRIRCDTAVIELETSLGTREQPSDLPPRYPHLLLQVIPAAESDGILLKRVLARNTADGSAFNEEYGTGAVQVEGGRSGNELAWLTNPTPLASSYAAGRFRSAYARVLQTVEIGSELLRDVANVASVEPTI